MNTGTVPTDKMTWALDSAISLLIAREMTGVAEGLNCAKVQLQQLREELSGMIDRFNQSIDERDGSRRAARIYREENERLREELEQVKKERDAYKQQNYELVASNITQFEKLEDVCSELEQVKKERDELRVVLKGCEYWHKRAVDELAAKDKVLEWYADEKTYRLGVNITMGSGFPQHEPIKYDKGVKSRSILSQYASAERPDIVTIRPEVRWFAEQMELTLQKNDHKGGWQNCDMNYLLSRLQEEKNELNNALYFKSPIDRVISESLDVANFAMMIADNARSAPGSAESARADKESP